VIPYVDIRILPERIFQSSIFVYVTRHGYRSAETNNYFLRTIKKKGIAAVRFTNAGCKGRLLCAAAEPPSALNLFSTD
jgi:hypothetical protein